MQNFDDVALRIYRATAFLNEILTRPSEPISSDPQVVGALKRMNQVLASIDRELQEAPTNDPGRAEGYLKGVDQLRRHLRELETTSAVNLALPQIEDAEAAGTEALKILMGYTAGDRGGEEASSGRSASEILTELRKAITGSNELNEGQKKDALGYVGALDAILAMETPDRQVFKALVNGLKELGKKIGNQAIMEAAKELIRWGMENLF